MFPNRPIDIKIQQTGTAVVVRHVSDRAYTWLRAHFSVDAPRGADGEWLLAPDALDRLLEALPSDYVTFRGM